MLGIGAAGPLGPAAREAVTPPVVATGGGRPVRVGRHEGGALDEGSLADERAAWIVLATVEGVGDRTLAALVATHGSARRTLWLAARGRLPGRVRSEGRGERALPAAVAAGISEAARDPGTRLRELADLGVWTMTLLDPDYPSRLLGIADPPPVLFGAGSPGALRSGAAVALVGTRRPTPGGRVEAARFAAELAGAGVAVVSGLAIGVDGAAHAAAVDAGGTTVAVIGSGHRRPGPRAHDALARAILATGGAIVGELPPSARATRGTYPRRNRIISGLADAVIVVEAPRRSGALITARLALEQGRPLWVRTGGPGASNAGCRDLLVETEARDCAGAGSIVERLGIAVVAGRRRRARGGESPGSLERLPRMGRQEARLAALVRTGPTTPDELARRLGLPAGELAGVVTLLQLRGLVRSMGPLLLPTGLLLAAQRD